MLRILLAIDGSPHSLRAAQRLIDWVPLYKDPPHVVLVTVHLPLPHYPGMGVVVSKEMIERYYEEESRARLASSKALLEQAGIDYEAKLLVGPIAETLVHHSRTAGCDCIYMGNRGAGAVTHLLVGSVVTKVLHIADVPVVVVP